MFNKEVHGADNQKIISSFASDKALRALVVAKVETKPSASSSLENSESQDLSSSLLALAEGAIELRFSTQVEYLGSTAMTVAFLKRENYSRLDLKPEVDITKALEMATISESEQASEATAAEVIQDQIDLST